MIVAETDFEKRIVYDDFFRSAIQLGTPRKSHPEGLLGIHIEHILRAIDDLDFPQRELLRSSALLHDVGKFAKLYKRHDYKSPEMSEDQWNELAVKSKLFESRFAYPREERDIHTPGHAFYSREFAKSFTQRQELLDLVQYHDTAAKVKWKNYPREEVKSQVLKYFGNKDVASFIRFAYVDSIDREKDTSIWLQQQCLKLGLLKEPVLPAALASQRG
jgi:hypothetical protein